MWVSGYENSLSVLHAGSCVALAVFVNTAGCGGGGNTVEFPENPDPMPKEPPVAAGGPAPSEPAEDNGATVTNGLSRP